MIYITVYGLDQSSIAYYSKNHSKNLGDIFECGEDELAFICRDSCVYHNGVEQNSWNVFVKVYAPFKFKPVQKVVSEYFGRTFKDFTVNLNVLFEYYNLDDFYTYKTGEYAKFITEENIRSEDDEGGYIDDETEERLILDKHDHCHCHDQDDCDCDDECDCDECDCDDEEAESDDVYVGDAFKDYFGR